MKKMLTLFSALLFCSHSLSPAFASDDPIHPLDTAHEKCVALDGSTLGMKQCNAKFEKLWDQELNKHYQLLGGNKKPELVKTQLAWIKFRDTEFAYINAYYAQIYDESGGGTMWGLLASSDRMSVVRKRALTLRGLYYFKKCGMTGDCDEQ